MKFIVHVSTPPQKFNRAVRDGSAAKKLGRIMEETKAESADFSAQDGKRGGYLTYEIKEASELPKLTEPWFLYFEATKQQGRCDAGATGCAAAQDLKAADSGKGQQKWH